MSAKDIIDVYYATNNFTFENNFNENFNGP